MRQNDRKPWDQSTACICDKCGEAFEPDREHICRKKNSYPDADNSKLNSALSFGEFVNGVTKGGYLKEIDSNEHSNK